MSIPVSLKPARLRRLFPTPITSKSRVSLMQRLSAIRNASGRLSSTSYRGNIQPHRRRSGGSVLASPARGDEGTGQKPGRCGHGAPQGWQAGLMASRQPRAPVQKLTIDRGKADPDRWPYTLALVRHVWQHGLMRGPRATILLGDQG